MELTEIQKLKIELTTKLFVGSVLGVQIYLKGTNYINRVTED
jgi:hypothetical protein